MTGGAQTVSMSCTRGTITTAQPVLCGSRPSHEDLGLRQYPLRPDRGSAAML